MTNEQREKRNEGLEKEARDLCLSLAREMDSNKDAGFAAYAEQLLVSPDRQAQFAADLMALAILSKMVYGKDTPPVNDTFATLQNLCRFIVAKKHGMIHFLCAPEPEEREEHENRN